MQGRALAGAGLAVATLWSAVPQVTGATVTVDGARTYQVIEGFGVNANHRSWNNNDLKSALDLLIDQGGMTLFRVIFDKADWEASNDNTNASVMAWSYYNPIYGSSDFQKMWDMCAYLNMRGITNGLMFNFQGNGPAWMGGATLKTGYEAEWAEMVGSAFVYARNTAHVQFSVVEPDNEPDNSTMGVDMSSSQYVTSLHKLSQLLDTNGMGDVRFVGPDLATTSTTWLTAMMNDLLVMGKVVHFGLHSYEASGSGSTGISSFLQQSAYRDRTFWMTEYNAWCGGCESGQGGDNTWSYARDSAQYFLNHLANGASAGVIWEGYDSQYNYYSPGQWSYWGLLGVVNINATPKTYTPRKTFYAMAQVAHYVRPGARRIDASGSASPFQVLAFQHPASGQLTLTGINTSTSSGTLSGLLTNLPAVSSFDLYYTSSATNLCHGALVPVVNRSFAATIPANCVFTLVAMLPPAVLTATAVSNGVALSWPAPLTNYYLEAATGVVASSSWSQVTNAPQPTGDRLVVTLPPAPDCRFFRLHQQ